jgi:hypothetical protein
MGSGLTPGLAGATLQSSVTAIVARKPPIRSDDTVTKTWRKPLRSELQSGRRDVPRAVRDRFS